MRDDVQALRSTLANYCKYSKSPDPNYVQHLRLKIRVAVTTRAALKAAQEAFDAQAVLEEFDRAYGRTLIVKVEK